MEWEKTDLLSSRKNNENVLDTSYLKALDDEQIKPVTTLHGPLLVNAGAGSGKTRVVTYRTAHMIRSGISPSEILLLTFTNKAAKEMTERTGLLLGRMPEGLTSGTYHHIANLILRKYAKLVGLQSNYTILDPDDAKSTLKLAIGMSKKNKKDKLPKESVIMNIISLTVNMQTTIADTVMQAYPEFEQNIEIFETIAERYKKIKKEHNTVDFDDLLVYWLEILENHENVRDFYANKAFRYKMIDEFQDTNILQSKIIRLLAGNEYNIMVVGDANQSIYGWRGAEIENILNFKKEYHGCTEYNISYNYRSTPEILNLANRSIEHNIYRSELMLKPKNESGIIPKIVHCDRNQEEATFIRKEIQSLHSKGVPLSDIAILYRTHMSSKNVEMELTTNEMSYKIHSGIGFFAQAHVKDAICFLRILVNPKDWAAWNRLLLQSNGIGIVTASQIVNHLTQYDDVFEFLANEEKFSFVKRGKEDFLQFKDFILEANKRDGLGNYITYFVENYYREYALLNFENGKERIQDVLSIIEMSDKYKTVEKFLEDVMLNEQMAVKEKEVEEDEQEHVTMMTIHKAKGLEWKYVFVIGLAQRVFPSWSAIGYGKEKEFEEERRLFYVAVTRAEQSLYMSYPMNSYDFKLKSYLPTQISTFLAELPHGLYEEYHVRFEGYDYY